MGLSSSTVITTRVEAGDPLLDKLKEQQAEQQRLEAYYRSLLHESSLEADSLETAINRIDSDISYLNNKISNTLGQIETTNKIIDSLEDDITENTKRIDDLNTRLSSAYVMLYEMSQTSTLELILQSSTLDEIVSQSQYIQSIQTNLQKDIQDLDKAVVNLIDKKKDAEDRKKSLSNLKSELSSSRSSLNGQKTEKDNLLRQTEGEQDRYTELVAESKRRVLAIEAQIIARINELYNGGGFGGGPGVGQHVTRGTPIGIQGSTGFSTGDHVHFEVRVSNVAKNPRTYINNSKLSWPLRNFVVTQEFDENWWTGTGWAYANGHTGIDIAGPKNSVVYAPADGIIIMNQYYGGYGRAWVMKTDSGGLWVLLGHLKDS